MLERLLGSENKDKVFCSKCKFFEEKHGQLYYCWHASNIKVVPNWYGLGRENITLPSKLNEKNNCKNYAVKEL